MDSVKITQGFAVLVGALAIIGLFMEGHFLGLNVDPMLDLLRIGLAAVLIYAGFVAKTPGVVSGALTFTAALYIIMGIVGMFDASFMGMLPSGLTWFDNGFHLITGALALWGGFQAKKRV